MKTLTRLLTVAALASLFALPSFAQDAAPAAAAAANPCEEAARTEMYTKYYTEKKNTDNQKPAYDTAQQYLAKYETCNDQYSKAVRKFADAYAALSGTAKNITDFNDAVNADNYAKANASGKLLLAATPNDVRVLTLLAYRGYNLAIKDAALAPEVIANARRAAELLEAGKTPVDATGAASWKPFSNKDDALGWLNYYLGALQLKANPAEATKHLVKVAQAATTAKDEPTLYSFLAFAYEKEAEPMLAKYKTFTVENDESRLLLANINQVVDRMIDAYARAVAFSKTPAQKAEFMARLTELYKSRNNNAETGLTEKIAAAKTTPLLITTPITTLPPATPVTGNGNGNQPVAEKKP